jgi:hypothetical protein
MFDRRLRGQENNNEKTVLLVPLSDSGGGVDGILFAVPGPGNLRTVLFVKLKLDQADKRGSCRQRLRCTAGVDGKDGRRMRIGPLWV